MSALIHRFSRSLEIDRAVLFGLLEKGWTLPAGLVTALLIAAFFSPQLQGYYYAFSSLLALQIFAELGLGTVLTYYASHEWARLALDHQGGVVGDANALSRLVSLARLALRWYLVASAVVSVALTTGGLLFLAGREDQVVGWKGPWISLCVITGLTLATTPLWSLLEGCNQVAQVYIYRFVRAVVLSVTTWATLYAAAGLWVAPLGNAAGLVVTLVLIGRRYRTFFRTLLLTEAKGPRLSWRTDLFPMQWRIALSWISGFFTFSFFTPVLFHFQGSVVAGQMGMTWTFVSALTVLGTSWVTPKAPTFGMLIAQRRYAELDRLFWRITAVVVAVTLAGAIGVWGAVAVLTRLDHPFAARLLPLAPTGYLLAATVIASVSLPMSVYLRAHKKEPLLVTSIVTGLLTATAVVVCGKAYSAEGVAAAYLVVTTIMTPFVVWIWYRSRAEWHGEPPRRPTEDARERSTVDSSTS